MKLIASSMFLSSVSAAVDYPSSLSFLSKNLPSFDIINKESLGFATSEDIDGLDDGVASVGANISVVTRDTYPWATEEVVPDEIFLEYVLPYASVNEARTNWRPLFLEKLAPLFSDSAANAKLSTVEVVDLVNANIWSAFFNQTIVFKSSQTPLIYDPMSTIVNGFASCTGVSIVFINALRAVGVPARIAGTPAWNGIVENGNHNWIEVWTQDGGWQFMESKPAGGGETLANPCDKWFCSPGKMNNTRVYAARWDQTSEMRYPMAWDVTNTAIPGVEMTDQYQKQCGAC